jgi:hypothetical protein
MYIMYIYKSIKWSKQLSEKQTVALLVKKHLAFYETRKFITVFTKTRHWSLFWSWLIQSTPSRYIHLRHILILSFNLWIGPTNGLLPSCFLPKFCMNFSPTPCMLHAQQISHFHGGTGAAAWRSRLTHFHPVVRWQYVEQYLHFLIHNHDVVLN